MSVVDDTKNNHDDVDLYENRSFKLHYKEYLAVLNQNVVYSQEDLQWCEERSLSQQKQIVLNNIEMRDRAQAAVEGVHLWMVEICKDVQFGSLLRDLPKTPNLMYIQGTMEHIEAYFVNDLPKNEEIERIWLLDVANQAPKVIKLVKV